MTRPMARRTVLGALGAASLAGTALVAAPGAANAARPKDLRPGGAYDRFVAGRAAQDMFSGTVLIAHHGQPVLVRAYGMANKDQSIPNRPDTVFWLASITKTFTALAIAQLVEQGKMAFHDTLGTHLDGFATEVAGTVTVHQLLTHTSGVGRPAVGGGTPPGLDWNSFDEVMDGTLALIRQAPLQFTPGTRYAYSNDGFFVLGAIVAKVTGQSYFDYIRQHVFSPAGMAHTDFYGRPQVLANNAIARPYSTQRDGTRGDFATSPYAPFSTGPAGGAYSTLSDLLAFARALTAGKLLNPAFVDLITSGKHALPPSEPPAQVEFYGYGYLNTILNNRRIVGHSGSGPGAANRLDIYPDLNWASIVLSNYDTTINPIIQLERDLITR
ncbi:serine hydrolase domain-containing protein [Micromonospora eburnea]|uniref:CubicO group peptidase, beta-lactamase class C family n=1 Tax=Micromonospora eburnea TaxID=227316 RepID=A0A1C6V9W3_9ACTN|nr:serine hydrolase domain-containing protein [Micromonospora eburnea]SCL63133.1 CubicO group peptidase, beta-lactamase class C family [Micromonospora eburnea]